MRTWPVRTAALLLTVLISMTALTTGAGAWEKEQQALNNVLEQDDTVYTPIVVELPIIRKVVEGNNAPAERFTFILRGNSGAPMPGGASGSRYTVSRVGKGTVSPGSITYDAPGTYVYTIYERDDGDINWTYDEAEYTLTITVKKTGDVLTASDTLKKDGKNVSRIVFTNTYEKVDQNKKITISGQKTWNHGKNPEKDRPDHIIVLLYADGTLTQQKRVTEKTNWKYSFTVPKYTSSGKEIRYEVDEESVEHYSKRLKGYDIINTYTDPPELPPQPEPPVDPGPPTEPNTPTDPGTSGGTDPSKPATPSKPPKTGDEFNLALWSALMGVSLGGFLLMLFFLRRNPPYRGRRLKKKGRSLR